MPSTEQRKKGQLHAFASGDKDVHGLHISRSFGDTAQHKYGISSEPEIKHFNLEEDD